jgi:hypothetical protein
MNELILRLVSKKVNVDGQVYLQPPNMGLKKRIFDHYSNKQFEKKHRNIERFEISELRNVLSKTSELFKMKNHAFQIDINKEQWNDLQIIHPIMISDKVNKPDLSKFGFVVYWTYDPTFKEDSNLHEKFKNSNRLKDYIHFKHDKVLDCYAFVCGEDNDKVMEITSAFMQEVLDYQENTKYYFSIADNGKIE